MEWPQLSGCVSWFEVLPCPYRRMGHSWPRPTSLAVFSARVPALGSIPVAEPTAGCLGSLLVPALAGRAGSLLEAAVVWIQPIGCTT